MSDYSLIDLHTHTNHSKESGCDNTVEMVFRDAQIIADRSGKDCLIAITDHNAISGIVEARKLVESGKYPSVKLLAGAEFTVDMSEMNSMFGGARVFRNMHVLAYGFDENHPAMAKYMKKGGLSVGKNLKYSQLVDMIQQAGGYLILAHPGLIKINPQSAFYYQPEDEYASQIKEIAQNARKSKSIMRNVPNAYPLLKVLFEKLQKMSGGIMIGMETYHPDNYHKDFVDALGRLSEEKGLVQTAGSDFHGYHLHEQFSVGNAFTSNFQDYYKNTLQDCQEYRNGIHVSSLPGIDFLTGDSKTIDGEIKMISGNGEEITYDQYQTLTSAYREYKRNLGNSNPNRGKSQKGQSKKSNQSYNRDGSESNPNNNNHNNGGGKKKGKKHKHKHKHRSNNKHNYYNG